MSVISQTIVVCGLLSALQLSGQITSPSAISPTPAQTNVSAKRNPSMGPAEELSLTGIADLPYLKRAFVQVDAPGKPSRFHTLGEGRSAGGIEIISIDGQKGKVTVRHHGQVRELSMIHRGWSAPPALERQKDMSHAAHHTLRARLDRERDDREGGE